jgi:hypothetical protein
MDSTVDYSSRVSWSKGSNIDYVSEIRIGSPSDRVQMCSICTLLSSFFLYYCSLHFFVVFFLFVLLFITFFLLSSFFLYYCLLHFFCCLLSFCITVHFIFVYLLLYWLVWCRIYVLYCLFIYDNQSMCYVIRLLNV